MVSLAGFVWGREHESYVYAIFVRNGVYFGETGDLPPKRWGSHLASDGTLQQKLLNHPNIGLVDGSPLFFIAINCDSISQVAPQFRKLARRAIEEELHRRFMLDRSVLAPIEFLLSEAPSFPVRLKFPFDPKEVASEAYSIIVKNFRAWREQHIST